MHEGRAFVQCTKKFIKLMNANDNDAMDSRMCLTLKSQAELTASFTQLTVPS